MHRRSSWPSSGSSPRSTAVRVYALSIFPGSDTRLNNQQGGEDPPGITHGGPDRREAPSVNPAVSRAYDHDASSSCRTNQTRGTAYRHATDHCQEAASITKATQSSQGRASALGHTPGNLQAPCQEKEVTNSVRAIWDRQFFTAFPLLAFCAQE